MNLLNLIKTLLMIIEFQLSVLKVLLSVQNLMSYKSILKKKI
jgi:hypothetical protein